MRSIIFFLSLALFSVARAEPTIEDFGALATIQNMAISPSGDLIAYRNVANNEDTVRVVSLSQKKALAAVDVRSVKPRDVFFVNDDQVLLRAAENRRVEGFRGWFDVSTAFSLDIDSGKIKQLLVPGDGVVFPGQSGLGSVVGVSPDGKYVYMPAYFGEPRRVLNEWADPAYVLLKVSLKGTGKPKRIKAGSHSTDDFFVDEEGNAIAMEEFDETNNLHRVFALQNGDWKEIYRDDTKFKTRAFVGLTRDRKHLVMLDTSDETDHTAYFALSLDSGEISGPYFDRQDADITRAIIDVQRVVHGLEYSGLMPTYKFSDEHLDQRVKDIQATFPDHSVRIMDFSPDWKHILVLMAGSQSSGEYYLFTEGEEPRYISSQRPNISADDMNPIGTVTFSARDGLKIPTIITIPKNKIGDMKNLPAVIMPHGGPASYDEIGFDYRAQALAAQGYMVIMPQFRGSDGFGRDFQIAGYGEWGGKMQDDISDAVKFFSDKGMIDPSRVCIVGASYGGYAALAGGAFTPELYKCVVSINGIGDLVDFRNWNRNEKGKSSEALAYWETQIGRGNYTSEQARERSPKLAVEKFAVPVLLIYSNEDEVVPSSQSKSMYNALKKAGKDVELLELDGDDHYLSFGETRTKALKATIEFINKNI